LKLHNPVTLFVLTWISVLFLYILHFSLVLTTLNFLLFIYIIFSCVSFILSYFLLNDFYGLKPIKSEYFVKDRFWKVLKIVFYLWVSLTILEIGYFRSLPILSIFGIGDGAYTEWGIPSLHGLLNSMILVISNYCLYLYIQKKEKKYLIYFLLCLLWPLILITRQLFMSMAVQGILVYFFFNKLRLKNIFRFGILALIVILLFGIVGDLRSGSSDSFINIAQPSSNYPAFLPSGFLWFYIYITSPLNNVNFNIHDYPLFNFNPSPLLSSILPSFIRDKITFWGQANNFKLVDDLLNVSSMFPNYLSAFGYIGSIFFYFLMGLIFNFIYFKTKKKRVNIKWVFILIVILHNILFSLFVDFFSSLVFIFQIFLHFFIGTKFYINHDKV